MNSNRKTFIRKNGTQKGGGLYKWTTPSSDKEKKLKNKISNPYYCSATPFSNGEDWVVTYVEKREVVGKGVKRIAYVVCDYVK